jgi:hypothetical protein
VSNPKIRKISYENLGVWAVAGLTFLIILEGVWEKLVNGNSILQQDDFSRAWAFGFTYLFPLFGATLLGSHVAVQKANGSWARESQLSKGVRIALIILISLYVVVFGFFFGGWSGKVSSYLGFSIPVLLALCYVAFFYKIGHAVAFTFKRLVFDLVFLFGIPFLAFVFLLNFSRYVFLLK